MKKFLLGLVLSFFFYEISLSNDYIVIDVRSKTELSQGYIENSFNITLQEINTRIENIVNSKNKKIFLYCRSGRRSGIVKTSLESLGYSNVINAGGMIDASNLLNLRIIKN